MYPSAIDRVCEGETTDKNSKDNFQPTNEYDEETKIDYPLLMETVLKRGKEPYAIKKSQEYYTGFFLQLRE